MPKRSSKTQDVNQLAASIVARTTGEAALLAAEADMEPQDSPREKDPAAVSLGRRGGLKGGKARAAALSPEERKRIATDAARKRWG